MSDIQERIAEVLREHTPDRCWWKCDGGTAMTQRQQVEHVAAKVAGTLGLVEDRRRINPQTRAKPCDECGHLKGVHGEPCPILKSDHTECGCPEYVYTPPATSWEHRIVSAWAPEVRQ